MRKNEKITALYERLSRDDFGKDDDQQRESNSISNQLGFLMCYHNDTNYISLTPPAQTSPAVPDSLSTNTPTAPNLGHQSPSDACGSRCGS